jgi:hypothetical protein
MREQMPRLLIPVGWTRATVAVVVLLTATTLTDSGLRLFVNSYRPVMVWCQEHFTAFRLTHRSALLAIWVFVGLWATASPNLYSFVKQTSLDRAPTVRGWLFGLMAFALGLFEFYFVDRGVPPSSILRQQAWGSQLGLVAFVFFTAAVVPFVSESFIRGVLYPAYRSKFGIYVATFLVLAFEAWLDRQGHTALSLSVLLLRGVLLCVIRERTASLWNCVLARAAFVGVITGYTFAVILAFALILPLCSARDTSKS